MIRENPETAFERLLESKQCDELFDLFQSTLHTVFIKGYEAGIGIDEKQDDSPQ